MKKFPHTAIILAFLILSLLFNGCGYGNCGDNNHIRTDSISRNIYAEWYHCYCGGATTTDVEYVYLTDSTSFRKYVGDSDYPYHTLILESRNDSIVDVYQKKEVGIYPEPRYKTKLMKSYNINELKKKNKFNKPCKKK